MTLRVEIAGGIACGKSTLCAALKERGVHIIPENLDENPYLKRAYANPASRGFDVQMAFLLSKASAIETRASTAAVEVCDYALVTEYAYTDTHLKAVDPAAHKLCLDAIDLKRAQVGDPDILLYFQCSPEEQLRRVRERGRDFEQGLTVEYLRSLNMAICKHVSSKMSDKCQIITIQSERNPSQDRALADRLLGQFQSYQADRQSVPALEPTL